MVTGSLSRNHINLTLPLPCWSNVSLKLGTSRGMPFNWGSTVKRKWILVGQGTVSGCHDWPKHIVKALLQKKKKKEYNLLIAQCKSLNSGMVFKLSFFKAHLFLRATFVHHPRTLITIITTIHSRAYNTWDMVLSTWIPGILPPHQTPQGRIYEQPCFLDEKMEA